MKNANTDSNPSFKPGVPGWYFLAEFPLSEFGLDHAAKGELTVETSFTTLRELGMPPECVRNIETILIEFTQGEWERAKSGRSELPGQIRIFCQRKMMDETNPVKTSGLSDAEPVMEHGRVIHPVGIKMNGAWGYYVIERGGNFENLPCKESYRFIELYIYKEGQ